MRAGSKKRRLWQRSNFLVLYYFLAGLVALAFLTISTAPGVVRAGNNGTITGTVYRDYNESGTLENTATFIEDGLGGVTVRGFDASNVLVGTTTTALDGTYTLTITNATDTNIRVEFDTTTFPKGVQPAHHGAGSGGTNSGTTVQFVALGATKVDLGVNVPTDFCKAVSASTTPTLATPCYLLGDPTLAPSSTKTAIVGVPYNVIDGHQEIDNVPLAKASEVGSVWGVTFQPSSNSLFASAFQKRHMGFGPLGTGGIYRVDRNTSTVSNFVDLNSAALLGANATGANVHPNGGATDYKVDGPSFALATKDSLGGLTISSDELTLFTVNLATRELISISLGANPASPAAPATAAALNSIPTSGQVGRFTIPGTTAALPGATTACAIGDVRPYAVKYHDGLVYVGIVCSNQSGTSALEAYVYTYNPTANSWGTSPVLEFPLTYTKGAVAFGFTALPGPPNLWNKWIDTFNGDPAGGSYSYPQAILTDITFYNGDMIVGLRDRVGDQTGPFTPAPTGGTTTWEGITAGDVLRASPVTGSAVPSQWNIENNAASAAGTRTFAASAGAGNTQGPGGGEYYYQDDYIAGGCCHQETSDGGLAQWPGTPEVVVDRMDPLNLRSGGLGWYSHTSGVKNKVYEIFPNDTPGGGTGPNTYTGGNLFQKAEGLGGVALICDKAPVEIGNRVWIDTNGDGIQEPGEPGLANVTVSLYDGVTKVGTVTTNPNGEFFFDSSNVASGLLTNHNYTLKLDNAADYVGTGPLAIYQLTTTGVAPDANHTVASMKAIDSDATTTTVGTLSSTNFAQISLTTGAAGFNNHTYDFGLANLMRIGNLVWNDSNGNGTLDPGESGISGVTVKLFQDNGNGTFDAAGDTVVATTVTDSSGRYYFNSITPGKYFVQVTQTNFNSGQPLNGLVADTITGASNNQNHGLAVVGQGSVSSLITLLGNNAPLTEESDAPPFIGGDSNSNNFLDFGFKPSTAAKMRLGNYIWKDTNNNGIVDGGETGIAGVTVNLILDLNGNGIIDAGEASPFATTTTDASGQYYFNNLDPNTTGQDYLIQVPASQFAAGRPLVGLQSSTGGFGSPVETGLTTGGTASANNNLDHGKATGAVGTDVVSQKIILVSGAAPVGDEADASTIWAGGDNNSNLTIDFGFTPSERLGNFVWNDANNNGVVDGGETGIAGVKVNLYLDNGNGTFDPTAPSNPDSLVATATTDATGHYYFNNVAPGNYFIEMDQSDFVTGGTLIGYSSSNPAAYEASLASPASGTNGVDHGKTVNVSGQTQSVVSSIINLVANTAPTGDEADASTAWPAGDTNSNLTLDFGFNNTTTFRIGNFIFNDANKNNRADAGELGIPGVKVNLLNSTGSVIATTTSDSNGFYYFYDVSAGSYQVQIDASNFNTGAVLAGASEDALTNNNNNRNHGTRTGTLGAGGVVNGPLITLALNTEPTGDEADAPAYIFGDNNSNSSQDFGFFSNSANLLRLGNYVWNDTNNNGVVDASETGIAGVKVNLYLDNGDNTFNAATDSLKGTTTTDATGHYYFDNLTAGNYFVQIDKANFNSGSPLYLKSSSTGAAGTTVTSANQFPYENLTISSGINNEDHGNTVANNGVVSPLVTLSVGNAPTGDETDAGSANFYADANSDLTIDFGFTSQMRIGNYVWNDNNNNGVVDSGETGISGVKVNLEIYNSTDNSYTVIGTTTTDAAGHYIFDSSNVPSAPGGLLPGNYVVQIDPTNFNTGNPLQNRAPSSARDGSPTNNTNDGAAQAGSGVLSHVFTLTAGGAPVGDESDAGTTFANGDNNSDLSVDFGFTPIPTRIQLAYFHTTTNGNSVEIDWTTVTEVENLGFNVYLKPAKGPAIKLNSSLIRSRQITGHRKLEYHLSVKNPGEGQYWLEDVNNSNRTVEHGPYLLGQTFGENPTEVNSQPEKASPVQVRIDKNQSNRLQGHSYDLQIQKAGIYRLTYEYLTAQGLDFKDAIPNLMSLYGPNGNAKIKVVAAKPTGFGPGDYIEWEAATYHNIYTDYNTYVLTTYTSKLAQDIGNSLSEAVTTAVPPGPGQNTRQVTARIEQNKFYWDSADGNIDPWFWDYLDTYDAPSADKEFSFDLPDLLGGGQGANFKVYLRGFLADSGLNPNHQAHAWLNGTDLGVVSFNGTDAGIIKFNGKMNLQPTGNKLRLMLDKLPGASKPYDLILFDYLEFTYPQSQIPTYDTLVSVREHQVSPMVKTEKVDYLIIAHPSFLGGLQPLVDLHTQEGLKVKVVDVNAIYDTYSNGIVDARSIKAYLAAEQKRNDLKYVLLVGGDSYDPMNYYGQIPGYPTSSPSFVPSLYSVDHYSFRAPSDQLYLDTNSKVAIGRLPVQNTTELSTVVGKIIKLAQASHNHQLSKGATFVSDNGADFDDLNNTLAATVPQSKYSVQKIYSDNNLNPDQVLSQLVNQINSGNILVNYTGHSGTNGWGLQTILRARDVTGLTNSANPLVVVQWACYNTYYASPYSRGLAETWLTSSGGAGFVLGATNQSLTSEQTELATRFYKNVFEAHMSLGQALSKAKVDMLATNPALKDIADGYVIMGDPALNIT